MIIDIGPEAGFWREINLVYSFSKVSFRGQGARKTT
jgi:hypothetical protein